MLLTVESSRTPSGGCATCSTVGSFAAPVFDAEACAVVWESVPYSGGVLVPTPAPEEDEAIKLKCHAADGREPWEQASQPNYGRTTLFSEIKWPS
jgi:hypothetical protein